jgi:F-type H+-transporting ATPase subunit a
LAPFHFLGEVSRTIALTVRLFGNIMSGTVIVGILISIMPLFFPAVMTLLGIVTGAIQAYIFAVLSAVFIAAGLQSHLSDE